MKRKPVGIRFVCAFAWAALCAQPAFAQPPEPDQPTEAAPPPNQYPDARQFVGSPADQRQMLDLRGSLFSTYDNDLMAAATGAPLGTTFGGQQQQLQSGVGNGLDGSVGYRFHVGQDKTQFRVSGAGAVRNFNSKADPHGLWFKNFDLATGVSTKLTPKVTVSANATAMYAPYYQYVPFLKEIASPDSPVGADYGYALASQWIASTTAGVSLTDNLTRRSAISVDGTWSLAHLVGTSIAGVPSTPTLTAAADATTAASAVSSQPPPAPSVAQFGDMETLGAHMAYSHNVTRKLGFHVGYGLYETRFHGGEAPFVNHTIDIGLGYGDGLTVHFARHYTLTMNAGVGVAKNDNPTLALKTNKDMNIFATGGATLSRSLGRVWSTSVGYTRGMSYVIGFTEPMITDTGSAGIGGPLGQRVFVSAGGGASRGTFAFSGGVVTSYTASTRVSYAAFRHLNAFAQASYYQYKIPPDQAVLGLVPEFDRRTIMVGLSTWVPLIKPPRRARDTR